MLQAEIAIVEEAGHTEESMTIFGTGRVSLGMRGTGGYLHADQAETDLAVIVQDETHVSVDRCEGEKRIPSSRWTGPSARI